MGTVEEANWRPAQLNEASASSFDDPDVVKRYRFRPPYSDKIIEKLVELGGGPNAKVLDIGTGIGELAFRIAPYVLSVDALDRSSRMIDYAKKVTQPKNGNISWYIGKFEEVVDQLNPPYDLVFGGDSLHWLDWPTFFEHLKKILAPNGTLAIVGRANFPKKWFEELFPKIQATSAHKKWDNYDMAQIWSQKFGFKLNGKFEPPPVIHQQTLEEWIAAWKTSAGWNPKRTGKTSADEFRDIVSEFLKPLENDGFIEGEIKNELTWGSINE